MTAPTRNLSETTVLAGASDPLDDALADLRITGSVLLHETYAVPWAISVPDEERLRELLQVDADTRVLMFHFVRRGGFVMRLQGAPDRRRAPRGRGQDAPAPPDRRGSHEAVSVDAAEVAICPGGVAHVMSRGEGAPVMPIEAILRRRAATATATATTDATELVCGIFLVRAAPLNPMLGALPPVLKVATGNASFSPMLAGVAWMLAHELDRGALGGFSAARVIEMLCAEAIRTYQRTHGAERPGWFKGLADPRVSAAIGRMHAEPARRWTVAALAGAVALSPSRFAARFRETTGDSVMGYLGRWRANVACRLLRETDLHLGEIARRVGYDGLPAFSRAFKSHLGQPPAAWRAARTRVRGARHPAPTSAA